jgi:hypothetical protein
MIRWLVDITIYSAGGVVHLLLVLAGISLLVEFILDRKKIGIAKGMSISTNALSHV